MLHADLLMGRFERVDPVTSVRSGRLVRATSPGGPTCVLLLARDAEVLAAEREMLARVAGPGVPTAHVVTDDVSGRSALRLDVPDDVQPLGSSTELPPATLREGLTQMLRVLSRAHRRGRVHGALSQGSVLVSEDGRFWLTAWGGAGELGEDAGDGGFSAVARDVRDLGAAFVHALLGPDERDDETPRVPSVADLGGTGADRDFRRVLSRLLAPDPRDAYASAAEVLVDLGSPDTLDPWQSASFVERGDAVQRIAGALDGADEVGSAVGAVEIVGPHGSGRTRLLGAAAAALRARGALVLPADAAGAPWGGLASLARQLTQLVGRESPTWREHQLVLQQVVEDGCVPTDGLVLPAATAIAALAEAAFAEGYGALLVDDADTMLPNAAETWRSLRRQAGARLGRRVLFVSTRRHLAEVADDVQAEVVTIGDWSVAEVTKFLEGVLVSADLAAAAAPIFRDLAGGRPGEIVGLMRDLERSGSLSRIGERWQLEVPLHALPDWTPQDSEEVRRCMRAAGRDAAALVEVLAVARQPVARDDCGRLAELPGPRLWTAAEAAETAGLIRREGSTWRIRSEHIRSRVASAMGRTRRRSLHREVLELLRRTAPDELGAQAYHARASGHPDASDLTRRAVDHLVSVGRYDSAVAQLVEAEESLGDPAWGRAAWAERIDLLRYAGRLGEALDLADRLLAHPETADAERADALVRRIHVLYESRDWDGVVNQELPETTATPEQLSELRYMRAAAYVDLCELSRAEREGRLAAAEAASCSTGLGVAMGLLEFEYRRGLLLGNRHAAYGALLKRLRLAAASRDRRGMPFDLCRIAMQARRTMAPGRALRIAARAFEVLRAVPEGARHAHAGLLVTKSQLTTESRGESDPELQHRFATLYEQTAAPILVSTGRLRRTFTRVVTADYDGSDVAALQALADRVPSASRSELLAWSHALAAPLELLGHQPALEQFADRVASLDGSSERVMLIRRSLLRARMLWSAPAREVLRGLDRATLESLSAGPTVRLDACNLRDGGPVSLLGLRTSMGGLLAAWEIRSASELPLENVERWQPGQASAATAEGLLENADVALALAIGVWKPEVADRRTWRWIEWVRRAYDGSWFPTLRWQAHLLDCRMNWRAGRLAAAAESCRRAVDQARWLRSERFGDWGLREQAFAMQTIVERVPAQVLMDAGLRPCESPTQRRSRGVRPTTLAESERPARGSITTVFAESEAELSQFISARTWGHPGAPTVPGVHALSGLVVVYLPELMRDAELREGLAALATARSAGRSALICTVLRVPEVRHAAPGVRLLLGSASGAPILLSAELGDASDRVRAFVAQVRTERHGLAVDAHAQACVAAYDWPGGRTELVRVAEFVAARAVGTVTQELLRAAGVPVSGAVSSRDQAILRALDGGAPIPLREIQAVTGLPRRSLQRRLRELSDVGLIASIGRGRSVRYHTQSAQG